MQIIIRENQMEEIEDIHPDYPYTCHHVQMWDTRIPWHWHEEIEFDRIVQGHILLRIAGHSIEFGPGEGFFTNTNVLAAIEGDSDTVLKSHLFHPVFLSGHYHSIFETKYMNPVLHNRKLEIVELRGKTIPQREILSLLQKAEKIWSEPDQEMIIRNIFSEVWVALLEEITSLKEAKKTVPSQIQERLLYMISYIQEHYYEKVTLEQIAAAAMISVRECIRCFKKGIGMTPYEYLMDYRLQAAKKMLKQTDRSVLDIAIDSGFSSSAYFGKIFRKNLDMTPVEYRRLHSARKQADMLQVPS